jgi:hypothetical protein
VVQDVDLGGLSHSVPSGLSSKTEMANGKKKHRRIKSSSKSSDLGFDGGKAFNIIIVSQLPIGKHFIGKF